MQPSMSHIAPDASGSQYSWIVSPPMDDRASPRLMGPSQTAHMRTLTNAKPSRLDTLFLVVPAPYIVMNQVGDHGGTRQSARPLDKL